MSFEATAGLIELGFFYTVVLGFGIWQLVKTIRVTNKIDTFSQWHIIGACCHPRNSLTQNCRPSSSS
jgi:hypothetical protein